jgi:ADP-heptose:LPS heptosyltransferase
MQKPKFLVIQTAFIGDAILATALLEKLHFHFPGSEIDFMIRKGNEGLFRLHPFIGKLIVWDKKHAKFKGLILILKLVRKNKYDYVINLQRFASTGLFTALSNAKQKIGFSKNPFSFLFNKKVKHKIDEDSHEIERNQMLIRHITDEDYFRPRLYPAIQDFENVKKYKNGKYICISPASVWFTKQFPKEKWLEFIHRINKDIEVYLLGGPGDIELCDLIKAECFDIQVQNLAGKLNLIESAALMKDAIMNYSNDSAPLHLASAMNAPITAIFCSTTPSFGFGPLSNKSRIVQIKEDLSCRPCGLHGKKECPKKHFKCGYSIDINELVSVIN